MAKHDDQALLESVRTHRERLHGAFLHGALGARRSARSLVMRLIVGVILGAVASAACVGVGFVTDLLSKQQQTQQSTTSVISPQPSPSEEPQR
ncbi:hypothetical protein ITJ38_10535 [Agreia pratensis]|uniref:hypothetical protein n=1 Tax=Agreia pratensis TaxID=150121 RepID=UPI00188D58D7|nr:hypothetical protein [Agreia pratensis]MBF4634838.1 hypothetical protein [Agreia pratensis]